MTPRMIVFSLRSARTPRSSPDCAVSIEIWSAEQPASSGRNEYPSGRSWMIAAYPKQMWTAVRAGDAVERGVERGEAVVAGGLGPGLHVGLVDLDDVGAGGVQVLDLGVDRGGVRHRRRLEVGVVVVLRLLRHRERAGHGHLDRVVGVRLQELHVADADRVAAARSGRRSAAPGWGARCGRARCRGCRCRRPRARWRSGCCTTPAASRRR